MARRIATVSGTAIAPGVSRNGRLYTRENIAKAVARAQARIAEGSRPISMRTHHAGGDDSTRIVGQVTEMTLAPDGSVKYRADIADTTHGHTIADLIDPAGGTPFLRGVSIRGAWLGKVRRQSGPDGGLVETADDLEIAGLDYTAEPGVDVADVADFQRVTDGAVETEERVLIYESVQEALVETATAEETTTTEPAIEAADTAKPYGDVQYADPGYQSDKKKRYPLDSRAHAKSAWSYINQSDNAKIYTAAQLKRIKGRIKSALKKFGVQIAAENWLVDSAGAATEVTEAMGDGSGTFCLNATNGPLSVTISSYCVDPADLEYILKAIVDSTVMALKNIDPDMDGDMDVPGANAEDTDDDMETAAESAPAEPVAETEDEPAPEPPAAPEPAEEPQDPAPEPAAAHEEDKEEPAMADSTQPEAAVEQAAATDKPAETTGLDALNAKFDKLTDAISGLVSKMAPAPAVAAESVPPATAPAQETAPAAQPAAETPQPVAETQEQMIARLVEERMKEERVKLVQETVEASGGPSRKGLVAPVNEHTAPVAAEGWPEGWPVENGEPKPPHKWTEQERRQHMDPAIEQYVLGSRAR